MEGIVACDDLSPFFSLKQLEQYHFSSWFEALQNVPYRARYSFMLSWTRFMPLMKFSIIATTAISGFLIFVSNTLILETVFKRGQLHKDEKLLASVTSSTFALFVLSYSKFIHYYTFVMGTGVMFLVWSLFVKSLSESKIKESTILSLSSALLLHLVTSIQLVFVSYFFLLFSTILFLLFIDKSARKVLSLMLVIFFGHFVPYTLYLFWGFGTTNIGLTLESVTTSYSRVMSNSIDPLQFITFPHSSTLHNYLIGGYVLNFYPIFLIPTIVCLVAFFKFRKNNLIKAFLALYFISFFFTLGFKSGFSAYTMVLELPSYIPPLRFLSTAFFEILRYPHRWAYIGLYVQVLFLSCFVILMYRLTSKNSARVHKRAFLKKSMIFCSLFLIVIFPFLTPPFFSIFTGDFGGALRPFKSDEMEKIKTLVRDSQGEAKLISFPRTDYRKVKINNNLFLFTDEFYDLFFEVPAIEGVSGTPFTNRYYVSLGNYLLDANRSNAGRYFSLLGVKYIFFHNDTTEDRMVNETRNLLSSLCTQPDIKLIDRENQYYLFEVNNTGVCTPEGTKSKALMLFYGPYWVPWRLVSEHDISPYNATVAELVSGDISWSYFSDACRGLKNGTILYIAKGFSSQDVVLSLLTKEEGSYLKPDIIDTIKLGENGWKNPDEYFSLSMFGSTNDFCIFSQKTNSSVNFSFNLEESDEYSVFAKIHAPNGASLACQLDDSISTLSLNETLAYRYFRIYEGLLERGTHTISIEKFDDDPLFFDLIYIIEKNKLDSYQAQFEELIHENSIFTSNDYFEVSQYISELEYPENVSIIYYCRDLYSPNSVFRAYNRSYVPRKAWYAGSFILVQGQTDLGSLEVLHLPSSDTVIIVTLCYLFCLISLIIILVLVKYTLVFSSLISKF